MGAGQGKPLSISASISHSTPPSPSLPLHLSLSTPPSPQGLSAGVGVLLTSALSHFPFLTSPLSSLLLSLAADEVSAGHVLQFLSSLTYFTEQLPNREIGRQVRPIVCQWVWSVGVVSGCVHI